MLTRIRFTFPQKIIAAFIAVMVLTAWHLKIPLGNLMNDVLVRLVMNGVLVLSLIPILNAGMGIHFGLPVAVTAGLLGMCVTIDLRIGGAAGFWASLGLSVPFSLVLGGVYASGMNKIKGREEIASAFIGFSVVTAMNMFWATAPFTNPVVLWPIGGNGMRPTISLQPFFAKTLNRMLAVHLGEFTVPVGLILFFAACC